MKSNLQRRKHATPTREQQQNRGKIQRKLYANLNKMEGNGREKSFFHCISVNLLLFLAKRKIPFATVKNILFR